MNVVVGIFDDEKDMDNAIRQLAERGFDDSVFDKAIIEQEIVGGTPPVLPGSGVPPMLVTTAGAIPRKDQVFKAHLKDEFHLPTEVVDNYATSFLHDDKFVIVKVEAARAQDVVDILTASHASRVDQHH